VKWTSEAGGVVVIGAIAKPRPAGGDVGQRGAHRSIVFALREDLDGAFEGFELDLADKDADVVAVVAGDFDASVPDGNALVVALDAFEELRKTQRVKTGG